LDISKLREWQLLLPYRAESGREDGGRIKVHIAVDIYSRKVVIMERKATNQKATVTASFGARLNLRSPVSW